ncbi:hypothetical protein ColLi_13905 [Colletotrichum liriopes]|uniref:Uncharacterized protein n=1 Tax=Colletotrichum liriopes TaxID=708192 RepID=A0AA37H375_9PEZI|nr:hypothetical protein ColLi_13905 [Colletotrichum liriopes]
MASNDMFPFASPNCCNPSSPTPLSHRPALPHLPPNCGHHLCRKGEASPPKNIRLPRLEELNRPLGSAVAFSAFQSQRLRWQVSSIDGSLIGLLNHRSTPQGRKPIGPSRARTPRKSPTGARCNVKYTNEQIDFIDYYRVDHQLSWKEVEVKYAAVFPGDAANGHKRGPQGLQGVYYRKNKQIPATDDNNLLLFDNNNNLKTMENVVREQNKMHNLIGLLQMHPERAINYPWVTKEHKRRARQAQLDAAAERKRRT